MAGPSWQPANEAEALMFDALVRNDSQAFFRIFATSPLYLPAFMADIGTSQQRMVTKTINGELYLMVFTSVPGLTGFAETGYTPDTRPDCYATTNYDELAAKRPDPEWRLAINAGLPIDAYVSIDSVRDAVLGIERIPLAEEVLDPEAGAGAVVSVAADFRPANDTEVAMEFALRERDVDALTDVLVVSDVLVPTGEPVSGPEAIASRDFPWRPTELDGEPTIPVFTSPERLIEAVPGPTASVWVPFVTLAENWPHLGVQLAVNPNSAIEFLFPGEGVPNFVNWAAEMAQQGRPHLHDDPLDGPEPVLLQQVLPADGIETYLRRGRHRVAGYVHRYQGVEELDTPALLHAALVADHAPFGPGDETVHVLRWYAHCTELYQPVDGQAQDSRLREFRCNSAELPHGAQLFRIDRYARVLPLASYDADFEAWVPAAPGGSGLRGGLT